MFCCEETPWEHFYKRKHFIGTGLQVQRLSPIDRGEERGGRQADKVLLRVRHMDLQTAR